MKPSGPGLLFVGRFMITVSISMFVMDLLRFSVSSWFHFGKLYPENMHMKTFLPRNTEGVEMDR